MVFRMRSPFYLTPRSKTDFSFCFRVKQSAFYHHQPPPVSEKKNGQIEAKKGFSILR